MQEEPYETSTPPRFHFIAPILAWIVPGLGHWALGYRRRARLIGAGILAMYLCGLLIGGLTVVNSTDGFWWYCGQVMVGPASPIINQWRKAHPYPDDPNSDPGYVYATPSYARVNEVGTLYTSLAGLLNLMAILDVIYKPPSVSGRRNRRKEDASS